MAEAAEEATELVEDGESLPVEVADALTEDNKERTEDAVTVVLEGVSEELRGRGEPGDVVLKGISRLCCISFSTLMEVDGFGRGVSSTSLVWILDRFSSASSEVPERFLSFWQISRPRRRLGRAGSSPKRGTGRKQS